MSDQTITCQKCGAEIPLTEAITQKIKGELKSELEKGVKKREQELDQKEQTLAESQKGVDTEVAKRLESEKQKLWKVAQEKAEEKISTKMLDLKKENEEKEKQLGEMREEELKLREKTREIESREKNLKVDLERKLDQERQTISEQAKKDATDEMRGKLAEKDKQLEQTQKALDEARRKAEQGSMQIQGDAQEDELKAILESAFPADTITDVSTGVKGADLIQTVFATGGVKSGVILWESKNTKAWDKKWISKLKDDQVRSKADICIFVSRVLPNDIENFAFRDGIWITNYDYVLPLVSALRFHLTELHHTKQSLIGKDEKMEHLYHYLAGPEFKSKIENIMHTFIGMQTDLTAEKRAMEKIWGKREKGIERVIANTSGMYGDLQGIIGASLPDIQALELPSGEDEVDKD